MKGKWKADNYGDWTVADFFYNGHDVQGEILNDNQIDIINPYLFNCPFLKTMIFKKVKKENRQKVKKSERTTKGLAKNWLTLPSINFCFAI